jgi:hypothetical protein
MRIAQSPTGQKLLNMLQNSNKDTMNKILSDAASGKTEEAKSAISSILSSKDVQSLLKELEEENE